LSVSSRAGRLPGFPTVGGAAEALVVALCRADAGRELDPRRLAGLADATARAQLLAQLERHAVQGLAVGALTRPPLAAALPAEAGHALRETMSRLRRRAAFWVIERDRVLGVLHRAGIDPVMLKGGGLCTTLYAEPAEREFGDLDLLVPEDRLDPAVTALIGAGYENPWNKAQLEGYHAHHFHVRLTHPRGFIVEVHFGLTAPHEAFRLDPAEFLAQSVVHAAGRGPRLRLPRPEHQLLHVVNENAVNAFDHLVRLVDLDRLIRAHPRLAWDLVDATARRGGLERALALSLHLTRALLGAPVPDGVLRRLDPGLVTRVHLGILRPIPSLLRQRFVRRPAAARLLTAWMISRRRNRWRYLARGSEDPLRWIWIGRGSPGERGEPAPARWLAFAKLLAYQAALYVGGLAASVTTRGRAELRFWAP
jgi:hypothetical protein